MGVSVSTSPKANGTKYEITDTSTGLPQTNRSIQVISADNTTLYDSGVTNDLTVTADVTQLWHDKLADAFLTVVLQTAGNVLSTSYVLPLTVNQKIG